MKIPWDTHKEQALQQYLKSTYFSESAHPDVKRVTKEIIGNSSTKREAAIRAFYFVRDEIRYGIVFESTLKYSPRRPTASESLKLKVGTCGSKAGLFIAILRAVGIPARYHYVLCHDVSNILSTIGIPPAVTLAVTAGKNTIAHFWAEVYLDDKWIAADTTGDKSLFGDATPDWDGESDALISPIIERVKEDYGVMAELSDEVIAQVDGWISDPSLFEAVFDVVERFFQLHRFQVALGNTFIKIFSSKK